ncbi:hypothetical protein V5F40_21830 [Xanthobacter sp. DSM 14520]|uniref:hypothetical protein n=1 Tax=Xanthobacter autotrophicus (strain ATCC BAA-1158 / Py2) TaxID=78245 RepID=UPI0037272964
MNAMQVDGFTKPLHVLVNDGRWDAEVLASSKPGLLTFKTGPRGRAAFIGDAPVALIRKSRGRSILSVVGFEWVKNRPAGTYMREKSFPEDWIAQQHLLRLLDEKERLL